MTPAKAKQLLGRYYGHAAVNAFDPLWPETMLGVAPGVERERVIDALRARLTPLAEHPDEADAHLLGRVLRSVAAQMIEGPGADWTETLEAELAPAGEARESVVARLPSEPIVGAAEVAFRRRARAMVAASGATSRTVVQLYALAETEGLPRTVVDAFLGELVTPVVNDEPSPNGGSPLSPRHAAEAVEHEAPDAGAQRLWIAVGAVATIAVVAVSIFTIIAVTTRRSAPPAPTAPAAAAPAAPSVTPSTAAPESHGPEAAPPSPPLRRSPALADGPPDGRIFARGIDDSLRDGVSAAERERVALTAIDTLRRWWPRIEPASRAAAMQSLASAVALVSQSEPSRSALATALAAPPPEASSPAALWYLSGTAGVAARLSREHELPPDLLRACREALARTAGGGGSARRSGSTFDEAALDALVAAPPTMLRLGDQTPGNARAIAESWLTAARSATGIGGTGEDSARRVDSAALDTVERMLTSAPDASSSEAVFEFCSGLLSQVRFREGDPGRDRVLSWLADTRLSAGDAHLITAAIATKSAAAGVEPTMVLSAGATPTEREEMRARYAEAWSKAAGAARATATTANGDWYEAARASVAQAGAATGDLEQLNAACQLAALSQAAALRSRGMPAAVVLRPDPGAPQTQWKIVTAVEGDGEWARRFLSESRTAAARMSRITEFEAAGFPGPIDCEVLAEAALLGTGETRAAAQRAAIKRVDYPVMVNAVLETLPKVKRSANSGDFLGQFSLAGALPTSNERWMIHYRRALVERLLTLLAVSNSTVAADRAAAALAEAWATVAGTAGGAVSEADGPVESVNAAARAYGALIAQVRQQVPGPTALIHPDLLDRSRAGRLLVAHGLPQSFAANQVSAVEALAVLTAAERPAVADQCRAILATMNQERTVARSVAAQIRVVEAAAVRLWAVRLGEPL